MARHAIRSGADFNANPAAIRCLFGHANDKALDRKERKERKERQSKDLANGNPRPARPGV
jgi:hypothetical protein